MTNFLQGPDGENSSKRLAGLVSSFLFFILSSVGAVYFLFSKDTKSFLEILDGLSLFAFGGLGLGVFDVLFKKKYGTKNVPVEPEEDDQIRR